MRTSANNGWLTRTLEKRRRMLEGRKLRKRGDKAVLLSETLETRNLLTGDFVSAFQFGSATNDDVLGMHVDGLGNTYLAGYITGTVNFNAGISEPGNGDLAIWRTNGDGSPNVAEWDGATFDPPGNTTGVGEWRVIDGAEAPFRDEKIILGVSTTGVISGQIFSGGVWSALPFSMSTGAATNRHGFDVVYLSTSGDALVVWNNGTNGFDNVSYRSWDGSNWSDEQVITAPLAGVATQLNLAADRNSDSVVMLVTNVDSDDYAIVWDGANWGDGILLGTTTVLGTTDSAVVFEGLSGRAIVVYDNNIVDGSIEYRIWSGAAWGPANVLAPPAGISASDFSFAILASDPNSNRIALGVQTATSEIWFSVWTGTTWGAQLAATTTAATNAAVNMGLSFESRSGILLATYGEAMANVIRYRTLVAGAAWSGVLAGPDIGAVPNSMTLTSDNDNNRLMLAVQDANQDLSYIQWDGVAWGSVNKLETDTGETTAQPFLFLFDTTPSVEDAFIAKYDSLGALVWAKTFGGGRSDRATAITVDNVGNVYVTGSYNNGPLFQFPPLPNDFDPGPGTVSLPNNSSSEVFVSKFTSEGNLVWAKAFSGFEAIDEGRGIAVDSQGNVHVAGIFGDFVDFDPSPQSYFLLPNISDTFITKLDSRGELLWAKSFRGIFFSTDTVSNMALDSFGNIYLSGNFTGSVDFDPSPFQRVLSSTFGEDVFVVKLDLSGVLIWAKSFGDDFNDRAFGMFVGPLGDVLISGSFRGFMDVDPGTGFFELATNGLDDAYVMQLNASGNFVWARSFGGSGNDVARAVTRDSDNNVYLTGEFRSTVDFDPGPATVNATSKGQADVFVARFDSANNFSWVRTFGGSDVDIGTEISLDSQGFIYLAGTYRRTVDFNPGTGISNSKSNGGSDVFRSRLTQELVFTTSGAGSDDIVLRRNGDLIEIYDRNLDMVVEQRVLNQILGIQLYGQIGEVDMFTVDFNYGGTFQTIHPLVFSGTAGDGDTFNYIGTTREVTVYRPTASPATASRFTWDGKLFLMYGFDNVNLTRSSSFRLQTQGSTDVLEVTPSTGFGGVAATRIDGTSSGFSIGTVTFDNVPLFTIDTADRDGAGALANDSVSVDENGLKAQGLFEVNVVTGNGADILAVNSPDLLFPVLGGVFRYRAGLGTDRLLATGDADWRINNSRLLSSVGGGRLFFSELEKAEITGGDSNNLLIAVGFSGSVILNGGLGDDVLRGGSGNDILIGGAGNDLLVGNGGVDQYFMDGTNGADDLRLNFVSATNQVLTRRNVGSGTVLETDTIVNDASDRVHIFALEGNDLITVSLLVALPGTADGGNGSDTFSVPGNWITVN